MIFLIIFILAVCWIWIIVDLKNTPLNLYDLKSESASLSKPFINFNFMESDDNSDFSGELYLDEIYKKKDIKVA